MVSDLILEREQISKTHTHTHNTIFTGGNIFSASADTTARVWDSETGSCVRVISGHTDIVSDVDVRSDRCDDFATVSGDICFVTFVVVCILLFTR
jgi:WD40 repeat protein